MPSSYPLTSEIVCAERVARWRAPYNWSDPGLTTLIGWFAVLFTGRWPTRLQSYVIGWMRWTPRVAGNRFLLVDGHPQFTFA